IAIEEWMGASPIYTKRMQRALDFEGDDVVTIFKGMQLDIGAPPQFMDFRYTVHDRYHGEFHLDHCGALLDVEPMGEDYVRGMCHDIEDPTFDATAVATNRRAQIRPIHRPPRQPADRHPHCAWTVTIDDSNPEVADHPVLEVMRRTRAATLELDPIDPGGDGENDYAGPLLSDLDFGAFSHSALVRIADEVCVQMHLLNLSFVIAVGNRAGSDTDLATDISTRQLIGVAGLGAERRGQWHLLILPSVIAVGTRAGSATDLATGICTRQLVGVAGLGAERIHRALGLPGGVEGARRVLELQPLVNPAAYVDAEFGPDVLTVRRSPAHQDGAWVSLVNPGEPRPLQAIVRAVDPRLDVELTGGADGWTARIFETGTPAEEFGEVAVAKVSGGATFEFQPRKSLPLTVLR